ncbi:T9SS type A sorting domain-containing protein [Flavobacteriales bacterium]|nr:T9SS type A sorting domain-containing protein [Flavobacteriales bacterium]
MKKLLLALFTILTLNSYSQQTTYVPDDAFEAYLEGIIGVSNGVANDDYVLTAGMETVVSINSLLPANIADFTGIEACVNLGYFHIQNNFNISSLDLSASKGVFGSSYFDLSVNNCTNLQTLITPDTLLKLFVFDNYNLTSISFSPNTSVYGVYVASNYSLESLDLSTTPVNFGMINPTMQLNISGNANLKCLDLNNGFCAVWNSVQILGNPLLYCIQVDDPNYSQFTWSWNEQIIYPQDYSYSTNCNNDCSVGINEANTPSLSIYPNPSNTGLIQLNTSIVNSDINVYSIEGKQINFTKSNNVIDISDNEKGVYLISIDGVVMRYVYQD